MKIVIGLMLTAGLFVSSVVFSHSDATGIVKERMDMMKDMSDKSKNIADMFKGKIDFNPDAISDAAEAFTEHGNQMVKLFPDTKESRTGSNTEALPIVWEEWEEFNALVVEFIEGSEALTVTVKDTDDVPQLKKAFFKATKSCSGCHKRFRRPKR